jgi:erythromycin esterase-like protein
MQSFNAPFNYLYDYVKLKFPQDAAGFRSIISPVYDRQQQLYRQAMEPNKIAVADTLIAVALETEAWFQKNIMPRKDRSDKKDQQLKLCFQNLNEAIMMLKAENGFSFRDSCMARMVQKIKDLEQGKIFLWAHNGHIMTGQPYGPRLNVMGNHLRNLFGDQYYNIGFVFHRGTFNAVTKKRSKSLKVISGRLAMCEVGSSPKGSIAGQFSELDYPSFFIDLSATQNKLFTSRQIAYNIGATFTGRKFSFGRFIPAQSYDGLMFVENTSASQLLPFR